MADAAFKMEKISTKAARGHRIVSTERLISAARTLWTAVSEAYFRWEAKPGRIEKVLMENELRLPSVFTYDCDQP